MMQKVLTVLPSICCMLLNICVEI